MTNSIPATGSGPVYAVFTACATMLLRTTRISWMANNVIPDSIIMNMICRILEPSVEPNEPNVRSTEVGLKNTWRILKTIIPVVRAFTAMDVAKPVRANASPQGAVTTLSCSTPIAPADTIQVARGGK